MKENSISLTIFHEMGQLKLGQITIITTNNTEHPLPQHSTTQFEVKFSSNRERCELCHIFIVQDALMHPVNIGTLGYLIGTVGYLIGTVGYLIGTVGSLGLGFRKNVHHHTIMPTNRVLNKNRQSNQE